MKKISTPFTALIFLLLVSSAKPLKAQISDADRLERCQNNKNRITELESRLRAIDTEIAESMGERQLEDARSHLVFIKSIRLKKAKMNRTKFDRITSIYNFKFQECFYASKEASEDEPFNFCAAKLENVIAAKIDKTLSLDKSALQAEKKEIDRQIAMHRTNLIALDCDKPSASGSCKLEGQWTQDTPGVGKTDWVIESDGTANERGIGYAKGKATLNGNKLRIDWNTNTGYSGHYEWTLDENCKSVEGSLVFKTGRKDTLKSTVRKN